MPCKIGIKPFGIKTIRYYDPSEYRAVLCSSSCSRLHHYIEQTAFLIRYFRMCRELSLQLWQKRLSMETRWRMVDWQGWPASYCYFCGWHRTEWRKGQGYAWTTSLLGTYGDIFYWLGHNGLMIIRVWVLSSPNSSSFCWVPGQDS